MISFLPDAARAGAKFIENFDAREITFDSDGKGDKVATGVRGIWTPRDADKIADGEHREVIIKAKRVIISAGTFNSPLLLRRSGLNNRNIGRNLHLHPVTVVTSHHPDRDVPISPWEGGILTKAVTEFENLDGRHHGVKLEAMVMLPSLALAYQVCSDGVEFKELCSKFPNVAAHIVLVRDRDTGYVYPDPISGKTRVSYTPSAFDRRHALDGILALAKIAYVQGAREIRTSIVGVPPYVRPIADEMSTPPSSSSEEKNNSDPNDPHFQAWLHKLRTTYLRAAAIDTLWATAHQMGTCRMSTHPSRGVVDPKGRVWGTRGLYVADASVFPSASGVNPMVTTMGIADWISGNLAREMGSGTRD